MKKSFLNLELKTIIFRLMVVMLMLLVTIILLEVVSVFAYSIIFKKAFSRAAIQSHLTPLPEASETGETRSTSAEPVFVRNHILHPYLGFVANPGTYESDWEFCRHGQKSTINEQGFLGLSPILKRQSNSVNICIFGGSFAMNFYLDSRNTLASDLRKSGFFKNKQINIISVAMSGWKQPQQLQALSYFLSQAAEYDVVINLDGFNEVVLPFSDNVFSGVYPYYPRLWNLYTSRVLLPDKTLLQFSKLVQLKQTAQERRELFASPWFRHSNFCLLLFEVLERRLQNQIAVTDRELQTMLNERQYQLSPENSGPRFEFSSQDQLFAELADYWERCSYQMNGLCRANGITYIHFLQPNQYVPDSKRMTKLEKETAYHEGDDYPYKTAAEKGYPDLVPDGRKLEQAGVNFIDLTMIFKDVDEDIYEDICCHVNKRGNDIIAGKIAETIASLYPATVPPVSR